MVEETGKFESFQFVECLVGNKNLENVPAGVLEFLAGNKNGCYCSRSETSKQVWRTRHERPQSWGLVKTKQQPQGLLLCFGAENETRARCAGNSRIPRYPLAAQRRSPRGTGVASFKSRTKQKRQPQGLAFCFGAENETRTRDPDLGKVVLYQLSYFRSV